MTIHLYNTLTRKKEEFTPIKPGEVKMYHCGPTVYDYQHIGNLYSASFADILRRVFEYFDYKVIQVMNITNVGHLSGDNEGDADTGEDRMEKGARKYGKTVWEVADMYTKQYLEDVKKLNIKEPNARPKATEFVNQMIEMIKELEQKGYTYETSEAVYFDISKFPEYGKLSGQKLEDKRKGVREEVHIDSEKRNPADFALWFKLKGRFEHHIMHWSSPWGEGFPGWHIECSAMSREYLGEHFDIHTGGVEHIPIHHTNEIAQSESANQQKYTNYWLHHQLILVDGQKMSKSIGNVYTLKDLEEKGFDPLALRLLYLQSKYREQLNFTFESLESAQSSLTNIKRQVREITVQLEEKGINLETIKPKKQENTYQAEFEEAIADDLNTAIALSVFFKLLKDQSIHLREKYEQLLSFDEVLGLKLAEIKPIEETEELKELKRKWQEAREKKDWETADRLREEIGNYK